MSSTNIIYGGIAAVLLSLLVGLFVSLYFYYHTKKLKDELKFSEASLREAKERAEEANRLKSAFLANMSHEIRTPLNAIVGFSDVLSAGDIPLEEQRGFFEIIKANSDLLLRLIDDILDLSRLEVDRVTFTQEKSVMWCRFVRRLWPLWHRRAGRPTGSCLKVRWKVWSSIRTSSVCSR